MAVDSALSAPTKVAFGIQSLGEKSKKVFEVHNARLEDVDVHWEVDFPFEVEPKICRLPAKMSANFQLVFHPKCLGTYVGRASCKFMDGGQKCLTVMLEGTSKEAQLKFNQHEIDFGNVTCGTEARKDVHLFNPCLHSVRFNLQWSFSHSCTFSVHPSSGVIPAYAFKKLVLSYLPTVNNVRDCEYIEAVPNGTSKANTSGKLKCRGKSVPIVGHVQPSHVDFGNVLVGSTGTARLTLRNHSRSDVKYSFHPQVGAVFTVSPSWGVIHSEGLKFIDVHFSPPKVHDYYKRLEVLVSRSTSILVTRLFGSGVAENSLLSSQRMSSLESICFQGNHEGALAVSDSYLNYGVVPKDHTVQFMTVRVQNYYDHPIHCLILSPGSARKPKGKYRSTSSVQIFHCFPESIRIDAKASATFQVAFRPLEPQQSYSHLIELFGNPFDEEDKSRLPLLHTSLIAEGHCLGKHEQGGSPDVSFARNEVMFSSCSLGATDYQEAVLQNNSDLRVHFSLYGFCSAFKVTPKAGILLPRAHAVIIFEFSATERGKFNSHFHCALNGESEPITSIRLRAYVSKMRLSFDGQDTVCIKPTCVGTTITRRVCVRNETGISTRFSMAIPQSVQSMVSVEPTSALIEPYEFAMLSFSFSPSRKVSICTHLCFRLESDLKCHNDPEFQYVSLSCEGIDNSLVVYPKWIHFNPVCVGESSCATISVFNRSYGTVRLFNETSSPSDLTKLNIEPKSLLLQRRGYSTMNVTVTCAERSHFSGKIFGLAGEFLQETVFTIDVSGSGDYPLLQISDADANRFSKKVIWKLLQLAEVNRTLRRSPAEVELAMNWKDHDWKSARSFEPLDGIDTFLGAQPQFSSPTIFCLRFEAANCMDVYWEILCRNASDTDGPDEIWVDEGEPNSKQDEHEAHVWQSGIMTIDITWGHLERGSFTDIRIVYRHHEAGIHRVPIFLHVKGGKRIRLNLTGITVKDTSTPRFEQSFLHSSLIPVSIGTIYPPIQKISILNPMREHQKFSARLNTDCGNNAPLAICKLWKFEGDLLPGQSQTLPVSFNPLEHGSHKISVHISIGGQPYNFISVPAVGVHPHGHHVINGDDIYSVGTLNDFSPRQRVRAFGIITTSHSHFSMGNMQMHSVGRKVFILHNHSNEQSFVFYFSLDNEHDAVLSNVAVSPPSGKLLPKQSLICRVLLNSGAFPEFFDSSFMCSIFSNENSSEDVCERLWFSIDAVIMPEHKFSMYAEDSPGIFIPCTHSMRSSRSREHVSVYRENFYFLTSQLVSQALSEMSRRCAGFKNAHCYTLKFTLLRAKFKQPNTIRGSLGKYGKHPSKDPPYEDPQLAEDVEAVLEECIFKLLLESLASKSMCLEI